jgi:hypothetical protein
MLCVPFSRNVSDKRGICNDTARANRGTYEKRTPKCPACPLTICEWHTNILQEARRIDSMVETTHTATRESHNEK